MATKRQQTMAKLTRERAVREKRERKAEKKRAAAAARKAGLDGLPVDGLDQEDPSAALLDPHEADGDDGSVAGERVVAGL
jgi:hypothetical protein